jgi:hypothetical protein
MKRGFWTKGWVRYIAIIAVFAGFLLSQKCLASGPPPVITVQPQSQNVPLLGIVTFSVTASSGTTMSYQWYFDGNPISGATSRTYTILTLLGSDAGVYCVKVSNAGGSVTSSNAYLNVTPPPGIATQPQNQTVTQGQSASFSVAASGTGPFTYQWYFNGSSMGNAGSSATLNLSNVGTANAGSYYVVVSNSGGSTTSSTASLTVNVPVSITSQPQSQAVTQGQNASFSVAASGTFPLSYQWYRNGSAISGANSSSLTVSGAQTNQAGSYTVAVSNPAGSATSQAAALTVYVPAGITTQPQSQVVTQGQNVSFSIVASGTAPLTYYWYFNGTYLGSADNNSSISINNIGTNNAGNYTVVAQNNWGSATSSVATLTVLSPPVITTQPASQTVLAGQNVSFDVVASGSGPLSYAWKFNGTPVPGATNSVLTLANVTPALAGNYAVVVTNGGGSVASAVATLTVTNLPVTLAAAGVAGLGMTPSGFVFQLTVPPGHTYVVLVSTDLLTWTPIATNVSATGSAVFTDANASNYPARMYRVVAK